MRTGVMGGRRELPAGAAVAALLAERLPAPTRPGDQLVVAVRPPPAYAGTVGARAVVESVSPTAVYVVFESGLRESFPPGRFAAYFTRSLLRTS